MSNAPKTVNSPPLNICYKFTEEQDIDVLKKCQELQVGVGKVMHIYHLINSTP